MTLSLSHDHHLVCVSLVLLFCSLSLYRVHIFVVMVTFVSLDGLFSLTLT